MFEDDSKLAKFSYIFFLVCTCLLKLLLSLKENTYPENLSLICNCFYCVKVAFPEYFFRICANICIKCFTIHYRRQNSIGTAGESHRSFQLVQNYFWKRLAPWLGLWYKLYLGELTRRGSPKTKMAVEHSARDSRIVIHTIRDNEMFFVYSLHKLHVANS